MNDLLARPIGFAAAVLAGEVGTGFLAINELVLLGAFMPPPPMGSPFRHDRASYSLPL